jgi:hypothetical protein
MAGQNFGFGFFEVIMHGTPQLEQHLKKLNMAKD